MKKYIEKFNEIKEMKNGKAILFFGFYLFFFIVLFLTIKFSDKRPLPSSDEYEKGSNYTFYLDNIASNNYHYLYTITLDGVKYEYDGVKYNNQELFNMNTINYYRKGDAFFTNNGIWIKSENPYIYDKFLDINNISEIIELATYESKTSYEDGRQKYNFLISSNTLNQKLNNIDSDFLEEPNQLVISTDKNKYVEEIGFKLDNYCTLNKLCQDSLEIKLNYDKFGEIEEIDSPIE